jgi:PAS domain S-box-containing protein
MNSNQISSNNKDLHFNVFYETIFNCSDIGIVLEDIDGKILDANPAFQKMIGYSMNELCKMYFSEFIHPHDLKADQELFDEIRAGKRSQHSLEKRYISKSGSIVHATISRFEIKKDEGPRQILVLVQNNTQQKNIISNLTSKQNLFNALLENSTDSIYYKDLEGKFLVVNKTVAINHKYSTPEQLIGKTDFDLFNREHAVETYNDEQEIIRTGKAIIGKEEKIKWPDGTATWISTSKIPFYNSSGEIIGTIGITRDVTEHHHTEEMLQNERIFMRTVLNNIPDAIYVKDLNCRKTFVNKSDLENLGCTSEDEAIGKTDFDFFSHDAATAFYADDQSVIKTGKSILNREEYFLNDDGKEKWLLTSKIPLYSDEGKIVGLVGIGHDITENKKSEKVREALYHISEAANTTSDIDMLYIRLHEIIQELIPAKNLYIALYDEKSGIISFPYYVDEREKSRVPQKLGKGLVGLVIKTGNPILADADKITELQRRNDIDSSQIPAAIWLGVPLILGGSTIGAIVVRDYNNKNNFRKEDLQLLSFVSSQVAQVIERKRSSDAIKKYADELHQLNITKDKFFSIIAHDLKNPFITILGFSELLLSDFKDLTDEEKLFYIEEMKKSADVSHSLLQNLLQWSRSQTGRIVFQPQSIQLDTIIIQNIELIMPSANKKEIKIDYTPDKTKIVFADQDMLNTILRNLLSNAIKFTNRNGIVKILAADCEEYICISVIDSGIGMTEEERNKLFRLDISYTTNGTEMEIGTGLGLVLCKEFIEKNGGKISVESTPGKGSVFNFTLPKPKN